MAMKYTKWRKTDKMAIKYTYIFYCKTRQIFTQIGIFGLKICHLATLILPRIEFLLPSNAGLPDGIFSYQRSRFWRVLAPWDVKCWYILRPFGIFYGDFVFLR
jgi:hypothetical protein